MRSNSARVLAGIGVVVLAVILLLVLKDDGDKGGSDSGNVAAQTETGDSDKPAVPSVPTVVVKNGEPVGGVRTLSYEEGDRIHFKVESNTSDEVHVHGYDIEKEVKAGGSVTFDFPATIEGIFEAEMHHAGQIVELIVNP